jgi:ACR3 family arsenite efflux pump ArsB
MSFLEKLFIAWILLALIVGFVAGRFSAHQDREPEEDEAA